MVSAASEIWRVRSLDRPPSLVELASLRELDPEWRPLQQSWLAAPSPHCNPGWARLRWRPEGLLYDAILLGSKPRNRARHLNERTWELGDVAEFFVHASATAVYAELHVTPENQRLQLLWPCRTPAAVAGREATLESFLVSDGDWATTAVHISTNRWTMRVWLPAASFGRPEGLSAGQSLRTAICRYDYCSGNDPELSSTALLSQPAFHRLGEWHEIVLQ